MMARLILPNNRKVLVTNPARINQLELHRLQDQLIEQAELILRDVIDGERKRVTAAVAGAVNLSTVGNLAVTQIEDDAYAAALLEVFTATAAETSAFIGGHYEGKSLQGWLQRFIRDRVAERVVMVTRSVRVEIKDFVSEAIRAGWSIPQTARMVDTLYLEQLIPNRSAVISRTEVISTSNAASLETAKNTPLPMRKRWLSTFDERSRDSHVLMDGQLRGLEEPFTLPSGARLEFPGDSSLGADASETISCRCTLVYEVQ